MSSRIRRKLSLPECSDEGVVLVPFGFTVNGTSNPDGWIGDSVVSVTRDEAGEFSVNLRDEPVTCFYADAGASNTADDVDIYGKCDWSAVASSGVLKVRTMTGAVQTDPTDNTLIGGFLLVKKTSRRARG